MAPSDKTWFVDHVNQIIILLLVIASIVGGTRWAVIWDLRKELTLTMEDLSQIRMSATRIEQIQAALDRRQDLIVQSIGERLSKIDRNTEIIKSVVARESDTNEGIQ